MGGIHGCDSAQGCKNCCRGKGGVGQSAPIGTVRELNEAAVHCTCRHTSGSPTRSLVCRDGSGIDNCEDCCDTKNFPGLPKDWESVDGKVGGATGDEPIEDMPTNQKL